MESITADELAADIVKRQQRAIEFAPFFGGGEPEDGVAIAVPIHWFDNLAAVNSRPWFVIDPPEGKMPAITGAARTGATEHRGDMGGLRNFYLDSSLGDRCIAWGAWRLPTIYGNSYQIVQTKGLRGLRQEQAHEARIVPLDGRPPLDPAVRHYLGDGRGHWEGNTLVVVTTNFNPNMTVRGFSADARTARSRSGTSASIERFTRISPKKVEWTMTFDDPTVWATPWTFSLPMTEDDTQIIFEVRVSRRELRAAPNILSARRKAEARPETDRR